MIHSCRTESSTENVVTLPGNLVASFGGEEVAIILPIWLYDCAIEIAGAFCEALCARNFLLEVNPAGIITVSIGVRQRDTAARTELRIAHRVRRPGT